MSQSCFYAHKSWFPRSGSGNNKSWSNPDLDCSQALSRFSQGAFIVFITTRDCSYIIHLGCMHMHTHSQKILRQQPPLSTSSLQIHSLSSERLVSIATDASCCQSIWAIIFVIQPTSTIIVVGRKGMVLENNQPDFHQMRYYLPLFVVLDDYCWAEIAEFIWWKFFKSYTLWGKSFMSTTFSMCLVSVWVTSSQPLIKFHHPLSSQTMTKWDYTGKNRYLFSINIVEHPCLRLNSLSVAWSHFAWEAESILPGVFQIKSWEIFQVNLDWT